MPHMVMDHAVNPRTALKESLGSIDDFELFNNQVLVAVYIRPEKSKSGIILPDAVRDEDRHQSKVGLILKTGPLAFFDPEGKWFSGDEDFKADDWVVFRPSDGWAITINGVLCRILDDTNVRARVQHPDMAW